MIYVVEVPHLHPPKAWAAVDAEAFCRAVEAKRPWQDGYVYACATARQLLTEFAEASDVRWIVQLATAYGWDTPLYRADHVLPLIGWSPEPPGKLNAYMAALLDDLAGCLVLASTAAAQAMLADQEFWIHHGGSRAREALHELLP